MLSLYSIYIYILYALSVFYLYYSPNAAYANETSNRGTLHFVSDKYSH